MATILRPSLDRWVRDQHNPQRYIGKVRTICGTSLIGYWPLNETTGTVAYDHSGNDHHGVYTGVDLGQPGLFGPCPYFDGVNDYVNIYSVGLRDAFNGAEGTILVWVRVATAGIWTDGVSRRIATVYVDSNNRIIPSRMAANNHISLYYQAGGVSKENVATDQAFLDWRLTVGTWSAAADEVRFYVAGAQIGVTQTGLGIWAGVPAQMLLGSYAGPPSDPWHGWLAHGALCNRALTPAEVAALSNPRG